jgi:hypothetical protein
VLRVIYQGFHAEQPGTGTDGKWVSLEANGQSTSDAAVALAIAYGDPAQSERFRDVLDLLEIDFDAQLDGYFHWFYVVVASEQKPAVSLEDLHDRITGGTDAPK